MLDRGQLHNKHVLRSDMKRANCPTNKATSTARMRERFIRCQRGLLTYEKLTSRDLELFTAQRGLPVRSDQETTVAALKAQPEQADDEATFDRFLDLPPELRRLIYAHYFKSLNRPVPYGSHDHHKRQPPVTLASRETRPQSIPLFYESCVFSVETMWLPRDLPRSFNGAVSPDSSAFIRNTSTHDFAHIKSLDLGLRDLHTKLALDLNNKHDPIRVVKFAFYPFLLYGLDQAYQERKDRLMLELRTIAMGIATRERSLKLQESYLDRLYKAVQSSLYS